MDEYWLKSYARAALEGMLSNGQHDKETPSVTCTSAWAYAAEMLKTMPRESPEATLHECHSCALRIVRDGDSFCPSCCAKQPAF